MDFTLVLNPPISLKSSALRWRLGLRTFWIMIFVLMGLLLTFYLLQISNMTETLFLLEQYEKEIDTLSQENKALKIYSAQVNSLESKERLIKNLGFVPIEKIHYIRIIETAIATK